MFHDQKEYRKSSGRPNHETMVLYSCQHGCRHAARASNSLAHLAVSWSAQRNACAEIRGTHVCEAKRSQARAHDPFLSLKIVWQCVPDRSKVERGCECHQHVACKIEPNKYVYSSRRMTVIQLMSCHIAIVVLASRAPGGVLPGMSWLWNHPSPGQNHTTKRGEIVNTTVRR